MTITGGSGLSKDEIERMMGDAEAHAEEDRRRREEAETRNTAETLQYSTEKFLADNGDKIPADKKSELEGALAELRTALNGADYTAIRAAQDKVARVSQEVGGAMYEATQAASAAAGDGTSADGPSPASTPDRARPPMTPSSTPRSWTRAPRVTRSDRSFQAGRSGSGGDSRQAAHRPDHR